MSGAYCGYGTKCADCFWLVEDKKTGWLWCAVGLVIARRGVRRSGL